MIHISIDSFGKIEDREILIFKLINDNGSSISIINYGAIVLEWFVKDKNGSFDDIILGCLDLAAYQARHPYFGCVVGRVANRINNGQFVLNDVEYQLSKNLRNHHLHGGDIGFDRIVFDHQYFVEKDRVTLLFTAKSLARDQGYPGNVDIILSYSYTFDNELIIEYRAMTDEDTPINLTNHCYFNLGGQQHDNILDHSVAIFSQNILETNVDSIPTGNLLSVNDSILDLTSTMVLASQFAKSHPSFDYTNGYDHCYVLDPDRELEKPVAVVTHELSGRELTVFTTEPTIQFYTGNWLDGVNGKNGKYAKYAGLCLETQKYVDAVNQKKFPSIIVKPGDLYYTKTIYRITSK
jgi:aldose 1-epimerase